MKIYNYFKDIAEKNTSQKYRLKNINKTRNYFTEEAKQNELMSRKHKKVCTTLKYIEHFIVLASKITGCISVSSFFAWYSYRNYEFCNRIKNNCIDQIR